MSPLGIATAALSAALAGVALAGLVRRRHVRGAFSFACYLASVSSSLTLPLLFPSLWSWTFVVATDGLQRLLALLTAVELALNAQRAMPIGRKYVRRLFAAIVMTTLIGLALTFEMPRNPAEWTLIGERVSYGTGFLFAGFLIFAGLFYVPLDPLHREVALGFVLVSFLAAFRHALTELDPVFGLGRDFVSKVAYPLIVMAWARAAWRRERPSAMSSEVQDKLHPWRRRV